MQVLTDDSQPRFMLDTRSDIIIKVVRESLFDGTSLATCPAHSDIVILLPRSADSGLPDLLQSPSSSSVLEEATPEADDIQAAAVDPSAPDIGSEAPLRIEEVILPAVQAAELAGQSGKLVAVVEAGAFEPEEEIVVLTRNASSLSEVLSAAARADQSAALRSLDDSAGVCLMAVLLSTLAIIPLACAVLLLALVSLDRSRASLFALFLAVPRAVVGFLASRKKTAVVGATGGSQGGSAAAGGGAGARASRTTGHEGDAAAEDETDRLLSAEERRGREEVRAGNDAFLATLEFHSERLKRPPAVNTTRRALWVLAPLLVLEAVSMGLGLGTMVSVESARGAAVTLFAVSRLEVVSDELKRAAGELAVAGGEGEGAEEARVHVVDAALQMGEVWGGIVAGTDGPSDALGLGEALPGLGGSSVRPGSVMRSHGCLRYDGHGEG